jgi:acetoin utilization deacetylase AcuC-like enzyme
MKVFYSNHAPLPLPRKHRFPATKYSLLRQRVFESGLLSDDNLQIPAPATDEQLLRVHTPSYLARASQGDLSPKEMRRIGFPWSEGLVERVRHSVGGTIAACRAALMEGMAVNLGGGTHHAHPGFGAGFCMFNDVAVAARSMQAEGLAQNVLILDCDVHQGDGTAAIFAQDASVFTFSIHGAKNFPSRKQQSDLDLPMPEGCEDAEYLRVLGDGLNRVVGSFAADLVLYLAGADPFEDDFFGGMALTKAGLARRDRLVLECCLDRDLPVATVLSGGYARKIEDTVDIHFKTIRTCLDHTNHGTHTGK